MRRRICSKQDSVLIFFEEAPRRFRLAAELLQTRVYLLDPDPLSSEEIPFEKTPDGIEHAHLKSLLSI